MPVSKQFLDKLETARKGQGHAQSGASAEKVIEAALDLLLAQQAKRRGEVKKPQQNPRPSKNPGHVTTVMKRAIWSRDEAPPWSHEGRWGASPWPAIPFQATDSSSVFRIMLPFAPVRSLPFKWLRVASVPHSGPYLVTGTASPRRVTPSQGIQRETVERAFSRSSPPLGGYTP